MKHETTWNVKRHEAGQQTWSNTPVGRWSGESWNVDNSSPGIIGFGSAFAFRIPSKPAKHNCPHTPSPPPRDPAAPRNPLKEKNSRAVASGKEGTRRVYHARPLGEGRRIHFFKLSMKKWKSVFELSRRGSETTTWNINENDMQHVRF
jgi:hypothetical protein